MSSGVGMSYRLGKHWRVLTFFVLLTCISIILVEYLERGQKSFLRDGLRVRAKEELSTIRSQLESTVVSDIYVANGLTTLIAVNPDVDLSGWDLIAANIMRKSNNIRLIGLAPDNVISHVYPMEGNESAVGLDYRTVPDQWRTIEKATDLQEIYIAGPVDLVQGGRALIARVPIYLDPPYNTRYWGVCSSIIDLDSLLKDAGVADFESRYNFAIRGLDSQSWQGDLFYGAQSTFDQAFGIEYVNFPHGGWVLAVSEKDDLLQHSTWYRVHAARLIGYPILFVLLLSFGQIYRLYTVANRRSLQDELTRMPNRRYFMYTIESYFESAKKGQNDKASFALLNIDLDKFKQINDTYGHAAGDEVLKATAERAKSVLRTSDVVARIGGDEFLILLPRPGDKSAVEEIAKKLEKAISQSPIFYESNLINIHASVGYVLYQSQFDSVEDMLHAADIKMYEIKHCKPLTA